MYGLPKRQKHSVPNSIGTGPHSQPSILPPRHQARKYPRLNLRPQRLHLHLQQILVTSHTTLNTAHILNQDCRFWSRSRDPFEVAIHNIRLDKMVQSSRGSTPRRRVLGPCRHLGNWRNGRRDCHLETFIPWREWSWPSLARLWDHGESRQLVHQDRNQGWRRGLEGRYSPGTEVGLFISKGKVIIH